MPDIVATESEGLDPIREFNIKFHRQSQRLINEVFTAKGWELARLVEMQKKNPHAVSYAGEEASALEFKVKVDGKEELFGVMSVLFSTERGWENGLTVAADNPEFNVEVGSGTSYRAMIKDEYWPAVDQAIKEQGLVEKFHEVCKP